MTEQMWGGRFRKPLSNVFARFNMTLPIDRRLFDADVMVSQAYADSLADAGVLGRDELELIKGGLKALAAEVNANPSLLDRAIERGMEDIHSFIEAELYRAVGEPALKLNTGRSRNDQVVTDLRLWARANIETLTDLTTALQNALVVAAEKYQDIVIPGYTHLQRAQPVLFAHHLMAYFEMLDRDKARLIDAKKRINIMPLGSGALAGTNFGISRTLLAAHLGFDAVAENSMDAVSDRDFVIELNAALALTAMHLSRFAEDFILFSTQEFGFIELDDSVTTGSSLMPQKKNADSLEIVRGKTGRVCGNLQSLFMVMKGLPLTYNKDMAEDKALLFDSVDTVSASLQVIHEVVSTFEVNRDKIMSAIKDSSLLATEAADYLVRKGIPFRKAHHAVGQLILLAKQKGIEITQLALKDFQMINRSFAEDIFSALTFDSAIDGKHQIGGTGRSSVALAIVAAKSRLLDARLQAI